MYLFDEEQKLNKYETIYDIIDKYYPVRIKLYKKRKLCLIAEYEKIVKLLSNKAKFIQEQCNDEIDLRRHLQDVEIILIEEALDKTKGKVAMAADKLRIRRTTLIEKMKKYSIKSN